MNIKAVWIIMIAVTFGGILTAGILCLFFADPELHDIYGVQTIFLSIGCFISACGIAFGLIFYRCMGCNGLLNFRGFPRDYCPRCGDKLN